MEEQTIAREVTASRAEFARGLKAAFPDARDTPDGWMVSWQGAEAQIALAPLPDLTIALLRLERHACRIDLHGAATARAALLDRLDRYQQRGGG